jgi:hypothetical protein
MAPQEEGFVVDPAGLDEFATRLRGTVDLDFDPAAVRIGQTFSAGSAFGVNNASRDVLAARWTYYERLVQATELMSAYVQQAEILAEACTDVARTYRSADVAAMSSAKMVDAAIDFAAARLHEVEAAVIEDERRVSGGQR